jgi:hypothetical protein
MPSGRSIFASAVLLEAGVLGLFVTLLIQSLWTRLFGVLIVAGLSVFVGHIVWMVKSPAPKPPASPTIDFAVLHAAAAGASLVVAAAIGLTLLVAPASPRMLHAAAAYGVLGIVGFLAQMVVAMQVRLLPLSAWYWAYERSGFRGAPGSPLMMRDRSLQTIVFMGWVCAVPALATGFGLESAAWLSTGAWSLLVAVAIGALDNTFVLLQGPAILCNLSPYASRVSPRSAACKAQREKASRLMSSRKLLQDPRHHLVDLPVHPCLIVDDTIHATCGPTSPDHGAGVRVQNVDP